MKRRFTEDGWRFQVRVHKRRGRPTQRAIVSFYDDTLHNPSTEDVHSVDDTRVGRREETVQRGVWLLTWESTRYVKDADELPTIEDHVSDALDAAWKKIETIEESPSEELEEALQEYER